MHKYKVTKACRLHRIDRVTGEEFSTEMDLSALVKQGTLTEIVQIKKPERPVKNVSSE